MNMLYCRAAELLCWAHWRGIYQILMAIYDRFIDQTLLALLAFFLKVKRASRETLKDESFKLCYQNILATRKKPAKMIKQASKPYVSLSIYDVRNGLEMP